MRNQKRELEITRALPRMETLSLKKKMKMGQEVSTEKTVITDPLHKLRRIIRSKKKTNLHNHIKN